MSDFETWCKNNIPDYRPEIDSEVICELHVLESAYKAGKAEGFDSGRKAGLEEAANVATSHKNDSSEYDDDSDIAHNEACAVIAIAIREKIK